MADPREAANRHGAFYLTVLEEIFAFREVSIGSA
jgi:hypothetical protein